MQIIIKRQRHHLETNWTLEGHQISTVETIAVFGATSYNTFQLDGILYLSVTQQC